MYRDTHSPVRSHAINMMAPADALKMPTVRLQKTTELSARHGVHVYVHLLGADKPVCVPPGEDISALPPSWSHHHPKRQLTPYTPLCMY